MTLRACLLAAGLLVVAAPIARAEEPTADQLAEQATRSLYDGRWEHARRWRDAWRAATEDTELGFTQPWRDALGGVDRWRSTWTLSDDGHLMWVQEVYEDGFGERARLAPAQALLAPGFAEAARALTGEPMGPIRLLVLERAWRESLAMVQGPTSSPLHLLPDPDGHMARFLAWQHEVQAPTSAERSSDADWAAKARAARIRAESLQANAGRLAWLAGLGLLALTLGLGGWLGRRRPAGHSLAPSNPDNAT